MHEDVLASPKPKNVPASPKPKKTPQKKGRKRKAAEPPPETTDEEEDEDKDAIIRCVCGAVTEDPDDERMMICCDKCECWQHNECMELPSDPNLLPESYLCELCAPENHAELLAKMARGEQPWLERARQRKTPRGRRGGRRKTQTKIARTEPKETPPAEKRKTPPAHVVPAADVAQARPSSPVAEAPPATPTPASLKKRKSRSDDAANSPSIDGNVSIIRWHITLTFRNANGPIRYPKPRFAKSRRRRRRLQWLTLPPFYRMMRMLHKRELRLTCP